MYDLTNVLINISQRPAPKTMYCAFRWGSKEKYARCAYSTSICHIGSQFEPKISLINGVISLVAFVSSLDWSYEKWLSKTHSNIVSRTAVLGVGLGFADNENTLYVARYAWYIGGGILCT